MSSTIVPVRSERESAPVGETVSMPNSKCVLPVRPNRLAMGVMVFVCDAGMEPVRLSVADRATLKVGV